MSTATAELVIQYIILVHVFIHSLNQICVVCDLSSDRKEFISFLRDLFVLVGNVRSISSIPFFISQSIVDAYLQSTQDPLPDDELDALYQDADKVCHFCVSHFALLNQ
jgi:hypothetical protein